MKIDKEFPNGFLNWFETSVEISEYMFAALDSDRIKLDGRGELWELIEEYTDEFEKSHSNITWGEDLEFFDEIDLFMKNKIKLLIHKNN